MNDEELLKQTGEGDKEAFQELYQSTRTALYSFILSIMKNPSDAEEILQETYLKIWSGASAYTPQGKPLAWMFTMARNLCYMKFRERGRQPEISTEDMEGTEAGEPCLQVELAADRLALEAALGILKEDERQIVLLRVCAGMKHRELAEALEMPIATVLSKYNRSIKKLERYLQQNEENK